MGDSRPIQSTRDYIYRTRDRIGQGAFSNVYRGVHRESGVPYAIKVPRSCNSAQELERETIALTSLCHENIVRLYDIQNEIGSGMPVFVMEFCSRGSVLSLLEDPENHNGLHDRDIIALLSDIASALKYLCSVGFVHRDIKPGNILVSETEVGRNIFKLSDFGSSKFIQETGEYESLTGTEEYLHPHLYERAFIDRNLGGKFTSAADLWSLGATLAHAVLGEVPFRPFEGSRKNRNEMFKMISRKHDQDIYGRQSTPNGKIEYYREIPSHCNISLGLRQHLETIIRGLLRGNASQWTLDTYTREANHVKKLTPHTVLLAESLAFYQFYAEPYQTIDRFLKAICGKLDIKADISDCTFYDGGSLEDIVKSSNSVNSLPVTSKERPLVVMSSPGTSSIQFNFISPSVAVYRSSTSVADDRHVAKKQVTSSWSFSRDVEEIQLGIDIIRQTSQSQIERLINTRTLYESKLHSCHEVHSADSDRLSLSHKLQLDPKMADYVTERRQSASYRKKEIGKLKQEMTSDCSMLGAAIKTLQDTVCWNTCESKICLLKNKVRGYFRDLEKIWKQVRERKAGNVSEGENVIRQTERLQLVNLSQSLVNDWQSVYIPNRNEFTNHVKSWIRNYFNCQEKLKTLERKLTDIENIRRKFTEDITFVSAYSLKSDYTQNKASKMMSSEILQEHRFNSDRLINLISDMQNLTVPEGIRPEADDIGDETFLFG
eukprot:XP_011435347.1 PREDICTED: serine/threonine-protein kinase TBK1-like [Crassostrea gigas]